MIVDEDEAPAEVWCRKCEQVAGPDGLCADCRRGRPVPPEAVTDPWLRAQWRLTVKR